MTITSRLLLIISLVVNLSFATLRPSLADDNKKLIWFGGYIPRVNGVPHLTARELTNGARAYDGFVIQGVIGSKDNAKSGESLAWEVFTNHHYTLDKSDPNGDYIGDSLANLQQLPQEPMGDRFLRINTSSYDKNGFDWTDDNFWDNVVNNLTVVSEFGQQAGLLGIMLDTEQYARGGSLLVYSYNDMHKDPRYQNMSYADFAALAERRGRQIMEALNSHMPSIIIFETMSYSRVSQHGSRNKLPFSPDSLLISMLDGMLAASTPTTTFIDGDEMAYYNYDLPEYFYNWAKVIKGPEQYNVRFQKYREQYLSQYQASFGIWLNRDHYYATTCPSLQGIKSTGASCLGFGWCGDGKPISYSPAHFAYTVQRAALAADKYVWFYSANNDPWLDPGQPNSLPTAYANAMREGVQHANNPDLPSLPADFSTTTDAAVCGNSN